MRHFLHIAAAAVLTISQAHGSLFDGNGNEAMCCNNGQWYVNADLLWWKAVEDSLPVAIITDASTTDIGSAESADVLNPKFQWDAGFRIGAGFQPCGCDWDICASWTHFDTKAKRNFSLGATTETIIPQWGSLTPFAANLATLNSTWHLHLNWADLELNRTFCVDPCFKFGLHGGLRGVWIDQKFSFTLTDADTTPITNSLHSKSDFSSVGVVAGLDASWMVGCGLSVNASAGGAILYGRQKSSVSESSTVLTVVNTIHGSSNYYISRAMTDFRLGLGWQGCVCDTMALALAVDWEHHILFNQNQFPRGSSTPSSRPRDGDLTMQGATFSATLFF